MKDLGGTGLIAAEEDSVNVLPTTTGSRIHSVDTLRGSGLLCFTCHYNYSRQLLPRDTMLARYMLSSYVRLSVRLSVCHKQHCIKTAKC